MPATHEHADQISAILHGLKLGDQVSCLIAVMFSHVLACCPIGEVEQADRIVGNIIEAMPRQWLATKAMVLHGSLPN